jgi:transposase
VRAEGQGKPLVFVLTGGECHELTVFEALMECGAVGRAGGGRPRIRPDRLVGDKGYSTEKVRGYLRSRGIGVVIPHRADQRASASFDRRAYRERNRVERLINRLKQFRRIATRYEKRAASYLAMLTIAAITLWL